MFGAAWVGLRGAGSSVGLCVRSGERRAARASPEAGGEQRGFLVLVLQAQFFLDSGKGARSLQASSKGFFGDSAQFFSPVLVLQAQVQFILGSSSSAGYLEASDVRRAARVSRKASYKVFTGEFFSSLLDLQA